VLTEHQLFQQIFCITDIILLRTTESKICRPSSRSRPSGFSVYIPSQFGGPSRNPTQRSFEFAVGYPILSVVQFARAPISLPHSPRECG
jgi:hypothetical protein